MGRKYHQVFLITTHLGRYGIRNESDKTFLLKKGEALPDLLRRMKSSLAYPEELRTEPTILRELLRQFLWGSPKFRLFLAELDDLLHGQVVPSTHRKAMCWAQWLKSVDAFKKLLLYTGIPIEVIDTQKKPKERFETIKRFNKETEPVVLLSNFGLNTTGFDCFAKCCTAWGLEPAFNDAVEKQAFGRFHRIGADKPITVSRSFMEDTYLECHEA
jgi:SNF2 family DNA or RNA helicase